MSTERKNNFATKVDEASMGIITILQALNSILMLLGEMTKAIEFLKNGDPDKVDVSKMKKMLLELPDLPEK